MSVLRSIFSKPGGVEQRATFRDEDGWFVDWLSQGSTAASGERVTHLKALAFSAYLACIRNISEDIAKLPIKICKEQDRGRKVITGHPVARLLTEQPNDEMTALTYKQTTTAHALAFHGGFSEIVRNGGMEPIALYPLDPNKTTVCRENGKLCYRYQRTRVLQPENVFVIHGLGLDGLSGYILTQICKDILGTGIAAQKYAGAFFGHGAQGSGILEYPGQMTPEARTRLRESWHATYSGSDNSHKTIILEEGMKYAPLSIDPARSQLTGTLQYIVEEVARLFRCPPHKIMHLARSTFSNIESQNIEYVQDCLMSWAVRWEQEIKRKLLTGRGDKGLYAKLNLTSLLRGDSAARSTFYREQFNIGALSINEIRELEDRNPIGPEGDVHYVPLNMEPAKVAMNRTNEPTPAPPPEPPVEPPAEGEGGDEEARARRAAQMDELLVTHRGLFWDILNRAAVTELDKLGRAAKRGDLCEFAKAFYATHRQELAERLAPAIHAYRGALWVAQCDVMTDAPPGLSAMMDAAIQEAIDVYCSEGCALASERGIFDGTSTHARILSLTNALLLRMRRLLEGRTIQPKEA